MLAYQPGVAALYQALDVPLVPVAVNSGLFWGRRSFPETPGRIIARISRRRSRRACRAAQMMAELEERIEAATAALERGRRRR